MGLCCVPCPLAHINGWGLTENEGFGEHTAEGREQLAGGAGKQVAQSPGAGRGALAGPARAVQGGQLGLGTGGALVGHRSQATSVLQQEECYLLEQCRGLDRAVVQLTKFVRQNQVSLNRVLLAEQKGR